jgi:hypothetical protein
MQKANKCLGTSSEDGGWDDWYGPADREEEYNLTLVQTSFVARALNSTSRPLPFADVILRLRAEATLPQCQVM